MTFLNTNILYKHRYEFRPNHSTIHPIIHLFNQCGEAASNSSPEYKLATLCDLSKAFDIIDHEILLSELIRYGIRTVNDWSRSYLSNRIQCVDIDGNKSSTVAVRCGVTQRSILDHYCI